MNAYQFRASLYCEDCAAQIKATVGWKPFYEADSETWPMGPYPNGGGEADTPQHCDACGLFLENPLTTDGYAYVKEQVRNDRASGRGDGVAATLWAEHYGLREELDRDIT